ncbi:hypothetical protein BFS30_24475 [Pedobacter steynii]|uniref:Secretion system C-terminal sorting domain-containing protein n=1 Tax=Pedobacter steynii TaxID=430522 RepID=A0A1D7QN27_9SPHI|nr:hypothetical protein BFS30_24475 [Pedobacter steynii]
MSFQAGAQKIYFTDTTNNWITRRAGEMGPNGLGTWNFYQYYSSDTLIERNGHFYTEIKSDIGWEKQYFARTLIRDDTAAGLVYIKPLQDTLSGIYRVTDTNEFVYLNYNLNVGDTLIMPLVFWGSGDSISIHVVTEVDSFMSDNTWYKTHKFNAYKGMRGGDTQGYTRYTVYEGVGPDSGPILEPNSINEYGPLILSCFRNKGSINPKFSVFCNALAIEKLDKKVKHFQLYPNPGCDKLTIKGYEKSDKQYSVKISDLQGKVLLETKFKHETVLDVKYFASGIYILQFIAEANVLQFDKLVIQK